MDAPRSRGKPRGRGFAHARGGRGGGRGKATRARGAPSHGMRVPPEYLQRVIAERQGLDPSALPDDEEEEDEDEAEEGRYRPRVLETNADRYREVDDGGLVEDDEGMASTYVFLILVYQGNNTDVLILDRATRLTPAPTPTSNIYFYVHAHTEETARVLEKMRLRDLSEPQSQSQSPGGQSVSTSAATPSTKTSLNNGKGRPLDGGDDDDVDHALGAHLVALRGKQTREGQRGKGQVITVEWDERMQAMSKEKAEAEAYAGELCPMS